MHAYRVLLLLLLAAISYAAVPACSRSAGETNSEGVSSLRRVSKENNDTVSSSSSPSSSSSSSPPSSSIINNKGDSSTNEGVSSSSSPSSSSSSSSYISPSSSPSSSIGIEKGEKKGDSPIIRGKEEEVQLILSRPPRAFDALFMAVPFVIYGKDKNDNYVAFCDSSRIQWDVLEEFSDEELMEYIKYYALFFWAKVDRRSTSSLTVVVDAGGFSIRQVVGGSVKTVLNALVEGLNSTVQYVGERPGHVFLLNTPSFLSPIISFISKLLRVGVQLSTYSKRNQWESALRQHIGTAYLPREYGGTNPLRLDDSLVLKFILSSVRSILAKNQQARMHIANVASTHTP